MASKNYKYLVRKQGGTLEATINDKPTIVESTDVMIRLKAIAINPADCKMIDQGLRVASWPLVPGMDGSGTVESVGQDVKNIAVGDEVVAMFAPGDRSASFQSFAVVHEMMVAKKPKDWSFEDAATLTVCYYTGIAALAIGLRISIPFIKNGPAAEISPSSVLILGGSSALGAATIQLLRLAIPECTILSTSSPKHHHYITSVLGANEAFDRNSGSLIEEVRRASPGSRGVDAIVDTVGAGGLQKHIFEAFDPEGPKKYAQVWTGDDEVKVPNGVASVMFRSRDLSQMQYGKNIMPALEALLREEQYKVPLPVHKVGDGFLALQEGLEIMRKGVSGEKLVVVIAK